MKLIVYYRNRFIGRLDENDKDSPSVYRASPSVYRANVLPKILVIEA